MSVQYHPHLPLCGPEADQGAAGPGLEHVNISYVEIISPILNQDKTS